MPPYFDLPLPLTNFCELLLCRCGSFVEYVSGWTKDDRGCYPHYLRTLPKALLLVGGLKIDAIFNALLLE